MGSRYTWFERCPRCGKDMEVYDAPSSLIWSRSCSNCKYDDDKNYYEDKDNVTIHLLTTAEAIKIKDRLYYPPETAKESK